MKLLITELYALSDKDFSGDAYTVILEVDGEEVMRGDYYHDKIYHQIDGFKKALKFMKKRFTENKVKGNENWD